MSIRPIINVLLFWLCCGAMTSTWQTASASDYQTIDWVSLMPAADFEALSNPPETLNNILDGSAEDQISSQVQMSIAQASDSAYQQALTSRSVVNDFDNQSVKIAGFVVPLAFDDNQLVTQFFLVPYFGACIHMPPPPPNQIIFASFPKGLFLESLEAPFWVSGVLSTAVVENDLAVATYSIAVEKAEFYTKE